MINILLYGSTEGKCWQKGQADAKKIFDFIVDGVFVSNAIVGGF